MIFNVCNQSVCNTLRVFHTILNGVFFFCLLKYKWQQVSSDLQTFLSILANFNNAVVWMVSILLLISSSLIFFQVFANGLGDQGSILGRVIPKTQKMVLDAALLSTQHYKVRIKAKWSNPGKGVVPSPTHRCRSYWKKEPSGHPPLRPPTLLLLRRTPTMIGITVTFMFHFTFFHFYPVVC